ncbi:MAG: hypothetical protein U0Y10_09720 [Spirosomataceae bacterium]|mgnify:CR=1 FL=1
MEKYQSYYFYHVEIKPRNWLETLVFRYAELTFVSIFLVCFSTFIFIINAESLLLWFRISLSISLLFSSFFLFNYIKNRAIRSRLRENPLESLTERLKTPVVDKAKVQHSDGDSGITSESYIITTKSPVASASITFLVYNTRHKMPYNWGRILFSFNSLQIRDDVELCYNPNSPEVICLILVEDTLAYLDTCNAYKRASSLLH